jgi:outer membrane protein assembly factor BamB
MQARYIQGKMVILASLLASGMALGQGREKLYSNPTAPDAERLAFNNLELAWLDQLPAYQRKDGIHDIHVVGVDNLNTRETILVQLNSGSVVSLDAETGKRNWIAKPDYGYEVVRQIAWNRNTVFAQCKNTIYAWNRQTGELRFRHLMDQIVSAPFIASEKQLFICDERGKLDVYELPPFDRSGVRYVALDEFKVRTMRLREQLKKTDIPAAAEVPGQPTPPVDRDGKPNPVTKLAEMVPGGAAAAAAMDSPTPFQGLGARAAFGELNMEDLTEIEKRAYARATAPIDPRNPDDARFLDNNGEPMMLPVWGVNIGQTIAFRPIQGQYHLFLPLNLLPENAAFGNPLSGDAISPQGGGLVIEKRERENAREYLQSVPSIEMPNLLTKGVLLTGPGRYQNIAYLGDNLGSLTAWSIETNSKTWKTNIGGSIDQPMLVTESDIFVHGEKEGLWRLDRASGKPLWSMKAACGATVNSVSEASLPLAVSPKIVAALDNAGRLLLLDRATGLRLGMINMTCWVIPVQNRQNDRIYLAANNGAIMCLRLRDLPSPSRHHPDERGWQLTNPTVAEFIKELKNRHGIEIFVSENSFKTLGIEPPLNEKMDLSAPNLNFDTLPSVNAVLRKSGCRIEDIAGKLFMVPAGPRFKP